MPKEFSIASLTHPMYDRSLQEWQKWRYTYRSGMDFINIYLKQYSKLESNEEFAARKLITYNPAFAKESVNEIKNSLFQRLVDVSRIGGSSEYQSAVLGKGEGVDLLGSSMNSFIGRKLLPELLTMSRVGVFVDMPQLSGITIADNLRKRPYLYTYKAEDIRTWRFDDYDSQSEFSSLLLRDYIFEYDDTTGLPIGETSRFRHLWIEDGSVWVQFYDEGGSPSFFSSDEQGTGPIRLNIDKIPFVVLELSDSLLVDVANYQIALMNIASSDLAYTLRSNYPFYTEQFEPRATSAYIRKPGPGPGVDDQGATATGNQPGSAADAAQSRPEELKLGASSGRRYPKGLDRPQFINPSSEPLKASMMKQEQMKAEIRQLVHLAVSNLTSKSASAESKSLDNQGLESGLSYIGLELENAERKIATYWSKYEGKNAKIATINYPEKYSLRTEEDRRQEAEQLSKLTNNVPSNTYKKEIAKRITDILLGNKNSTATLDKIKSEIDKSTLIITPDILMQLIQSGVCDLATAEEILGLPSGTAEKAKKDHVERLARIAEAQTLKGDPAARGIKDFADNPAADGSKEKLAAKDTTTDSTPTDKTRGKGVKTP